VSLLPRSIARSPQVPLPPIPPSSGPALLRPCPPPAPPYSLRPASATRISSPSRRNPLFKVHDTSVELRRLAHLHPDFQRPVQVRFRISTLLPLPTALAAGLLQSPLPVVCSSPPTDTSTGAI
jgi:hypothetical protein